MVYSIKKNVSIFIKIFFSYFIIVNYAFPEDTISKQEIDKLIYEYIMDNPEVILESVDKLRKTFDIPKNISDDKTFKMEAIRHAVKHIKKIKKPSIVISLQANSPDVKSYDIDKSIEKLINFNLNEVISTDENHNQNGTLRTMRYKTTFQEDLSTYCGFIVTNTSDIHTMQDLKNLEKIENYEIK